MSGSGHASATRNKRHERDRTPSRKGRRAGQTTQDSWTQGRAGQSTQDSWTHIQNTAVSTAQASLLPLNSFQKDLPAARGEQGAQCLVTKIERVGLELGDQRWHSHQREVARRHLGARRGTSYAAKHGTARGWPPDTCLGLRRPTSAAAPLAQTRSNRECIPIRLFLQG